MLIEVFTLFPSMFDGYLQESILKRAQQAGLLTVRLHNIRDWAADKHHMTDDTPYGGGGGMVMKPEPIFAAIESVLGISNSKTPTPPPIRPPNHPTTPRQRPVAKAEWEPPIILLSPAGRKFTQGVAKELAAHEHIAFICGRYEGVDERVREHLATDEISIGDFVLTGGELPAMMIIDAVARHLPGVLGAENAVEDDSHASGLLEYPHYTRPPDFRGWAVPDVLQSGDHAKIARWRREQSLRRTWQLRPDLLRTAELTEADRKFLQKLKEESDQQLANSDRRTADG
ncbi:MAG: tRNA (guanosine(37)-N1)-methyltransferase TrmD [Chloroflexi bacterium]|nr:tRNA (guanosine(37)-N1)-methyltransferase TrmD [Chloroflexota bacterium]